MNTIEISTLGVDTKLLATGSPIKKTLQKVHQSTDSVWFGPRVAELSFASQNW